MSDLIKLEKRFEKALEKLELALASIDSKQASDSSNEKEQLMQASHNNIDGLLVEIDRLEKVTKNDAEEIDKLVKKLKEIFELVDD